MSEVLPYQDHHLAAVIQLLRGNIPKYFAASEEPELIEYLKSKREDYFVLVDNEVVVGSGGINFFPQEQLARISWDIIAPSSQGKGYGTKLVTFRLNYLLQFEHIKKVVVRTSQHVYPFYEKQGFIIQSIEKDYWAPGFDLYLLEKENC